MPDLNFCPFCGANTVDQGPQRTYCTTCGEDVATFGQIDALKDELLEARTNESDADKARAEVQTALEDEEAKVLALYLEIDDLKAELSTTQTALETAAELLVEFKEVINLILVGKVNPTKLTDLHKRL